ncbi:MAG: (Fe-S)-binding protein [Desulfosalsimonas sp.]
MKDVSLFIPCIVDQWLPDTGFAAAELLRRAGCRPFFRSRQTCCGQVLYNAGRVREARKLARRFITIFENDGAIVCPSASCVNMVRGNFPALFAGEPGWQMRAKALAERVWELCGFLATGLGITDVGARFYGRAAYHESCSHLHGGALAGAALSLLGGVEGLEPYPIRGSDLCCGFGGSFSVKYPEISADMAAQRAEGFMETGADVLVLFEPGCLLQMKGYLSRHHPGKQVTHIADFLAGNMR